MRIPVILCWGLNKLGWEGEIMHMESPSSTIKINVCARCHTYQLESHGLKFAGKVSQATEEFPVISDLLETVGYTAAAGEVNRLAQMMVDESLV